MNGTDLLDNASDVDTPHANLSVCGVFSLLDTNTSAGASASVGSPAVIPAGSLSVLSDGSWSFTPAAQWSGMFVVNYTVCDGSGGNVSSSITLCFDPVNDPPEDDDESAVCVDEDSGLFERALLQGATDVDGDSPLTVCGTFAVSGQSPASVGSLTSWSAGSLSVNSSGSALFEPAQDWYGNFSVSYTVCDPFGGNTSSTAHFCVLPVNDPPVDPDDAPPCVDEDPESPLQLNVLDGATDVDNTLAQLSVCGSFSAVANANASDAATASVGGTAQLQAGSVTIAANGSVSFWPALNWNGMVNVSYTVCDGSGGNDTSVLTLCVTPGGCCLVGWRAGPLQ